MHAEAVNIALGFGSALLDLANDHTNNSAGNPLVAQDQELTTAGDLARKAADEFAATLVSLGGDFDRTVSDWGRLQALGVPLRANQIPWDARASFLESAGRPTETRATACRPVV